MTGQTEFSLMEFTSAPDPEPLVRAMQAAGPVVRAKIPIIGRIWVTTTTEATRSLLKDKDNFCREPMNAGRRKPLYYRIIPRTLAPMMQNIAVRDDPDHRRLRKLVELAFSRHSIEDMRPRLEEMADGLLDAFDPTQPADLLNSYARKLPLLAICELLGVTAEDRRKIMPHLANFGNMTGLWSFMRGIRGLKFVTRHFREDIVRQRQSPRPGLIAELIAARDGDDALTEDELIAMILTLFVAGHETTVHLIANCIATLLMFPDQRAELQADRTLLPLAVEELHRFNTPAFMTKPHFVKRDMAFHGVELKQGDMITALLIGANYDQSQFDAPDELQLSRRPNAHLGFGSGIHVCLGMQLARIETQVALDRLMTRFPQFAATDSEGNLTRGKRIGMRGYQKVEVRLQP